MGVKAVKHGWGLMRLEGGGGGWGKGERGLRGGLGGEGAELSVWLVYL
jgi:hypothetical protein